MLTGEHLAPANKTILDLSAIATAVGTVLDYLPAIAALFSCVWIGLNILDWFERRRIRKREEARRLAEEQKRVQ